MLIDLTFVQTQDVAKAIAAKKFDLALSLRDPEFEDCLMAFRATTRLNVEYRVPEAKRMKIGIIQYVLYIYLVFSKTNSDRPQFYFDL